MLRPDYPIRTERLVLAVCLDGKVIGDVAIGFEDLGLHRIQAECDARNEPSRRVMERLGMRPEARLRHHEICKGEWGDSHVYAMLAEECRKLT